MKRADACAGIEHGEDEKGFEHDREVIPDAEEAFAADSAGKNLRHAHGERRSAAGTVEKSLLTDGMSQSRHRTG